MAFAFVSLTLLGAAEPPKLKVEFKFGEERCETGINGNWRSNWTDGEGMAALKAMLPKGTKTIEIVSDQMDAPYRCIGGVVFSLQRFGIRRFEWGGAMGHEMKRLQRPQ